MGMKILVLGGNGFIGSHLVDSLAARGMRLRVLDRAGSLKGRPHHGVDYRQADLADIAAVTEALADMDVVIHSISATVPATANLDPIADIQGNLIGTVRLLQAMREVGTPKLIFVSSGGTVYGNTLSTPVLETHPRNPMSSYGIVKAAIENYIAMYVKSAGFDSLILRVSNPYGPRQGHLGVQGVIPTFFQRILNNEPIKIWGDGNIIRDYIYISDLISFMTSAIGENLTGIYNVGSGNGTSLNKVLGVVSEITDTSPKIEYLPRRSFDVENIVLDITKARKMTNWKPLVPLREGCEKYWQWLKEPHYN